MSSNSDAAAFAVAQWEDTLRRQIPRELRPWTRFDDETNEMFEGEPIPTEQGARLAWLKTAIHVRRALEAALSPQDSVRLKMWPEYTALPTYTLIRTRMEKIRRFLRVSQTPSPN
jgi:hypothetical protein